MLEKLTALILSSLLAGTVLFCLISVSSKDPSHAQGEDPRQSIDKNIVLNYQNNFILLTRITSYVNIFSTGETK